MPRRRRVRLEAEIGRHPLDPQVVPGIRDQERGLHPPRPHPRRGRLEALERGRADRRRHHGIRGDTMRDQPFASRLPRSSGRRVRRRRAPGSCRPGPPRTAASRVRAGPRTRAKDRRRTAPRRGRGSRPRVRSCWRRRCAPPARRRSPCPRTRSRSSWPRRRSRSDGMSTDRLHEGDANNASTNAADRAEPVRAMRIQTPTDPRSSTSSPESRSLTCVQRRRVRAGRGTRVGRNPDPGRPSGRTSRPRPR